MRRERQFTVNWIIRDRVSPTGRTLNSFPISRFETNLKSRQQTSQKRKPLSEKRKLLLLFIFTPLERNRPGEGSMHAPAHPLSRPQARERAGENICFERPCQYSHQMIKAAERDELRARSWAEFSFFGNLRNIGRRRGKKGQSGNELGRDRYHLMVIILFQTLNKNEGPVDRVLLLLFAGVQRQATKTYPLT